MKKRKICIFTGTRAEYGLLYWLMKEVQNDSDLELQTIVSCMHLSPEFGLTVREIENDGFKIDEKIEMLLSSDTPVGIAKSTGLGMIGYSEALQRLKPDLIVMLGDRFELLALASAALYARIPVAHLFGGELTEGVIDDPIRHALTKLSHLHFVTAEPYKKRVIQMGESPDRVFNFGALGLENIKKMNFVNLAELSKQINFKLKKDFFLVTYHPETLAVKKPESAVEALLNALDEFPNHQIIFTKPNADTRGRSIIKIIDDYVARNPERSVSFSSLGFQRYLNALKLCSAVIGNSSSGIIEAPLLNKATVNIGNRQKGRLLANSIINCTDEQSDIKAAINRAISTDFQNGLSTCTSPYVGPGNTSEKIKDVLKSFSLSESLLLKRFHDL